MAKTYHERMQEAYKLIQKLDALKKPMSEDDAKNYIALKTRYDEGVIYEDDFSTLQRLAAKYQVA